MKSPLWRLALAVVAALAAASCSVDPAITDDVAVVAEVPVATATPSPTVGATAAPRGSEVASAPEAAPTPRANGLPVGTATELPPAPVGFESLAAEQSLGPQPVSITIDTIDVAEASIIAVGVNEDLSFEVPPADLVGWYEFGPRPGEDGSAVLAAHVAYDGVDGVFRYLSDVDVGSIIQVGFDDGSTSRYRVTDVTDYFKEELPDSLFAQSGDPQLALITCGGAFNPELRSFDSNTVVVAVPLGA